MRTPLRRRIIDSDDPYAGGGLAVDKRGKCVYNALS